jgi:hypothetical protein
MGRAGQEIYVAARPSLFTLVRIRESVNRALDRPDLCELCCCENSAARA